MAKKTKEISLGLALNVLNGAQDDVEKFNRGNNAAGTRVRKAMQELKGIAQGIRNSVTEIKASR